MNCQKYLLSLLIVTVLIARCHMVHSLPIEQNGRQSSYNVCCDDGPQFELQFRSLIMQPSASNLNYAAQATPIPLPSPTWDIFEIQPHYHFGFDVRAQAFIRERDSSVRLNWLHFKHADSACQNVPSSNDMIGPFFEIGPDALPYKQATGKASFQFDNVNLTYGQYVDMGAYFHMRLSSGASFARIRQHVFSQFSNTDHTIVRTICVPTVYIGAGPQIGLDFYYMLCNNFYFTTRSSCSILLGKLKNHTTFEALSPALQGLGITPPNTQTTCPQSKTQIVSGFDIQLGMAYDFVACKNYSMQCEIGYQALVYIEPIQSVDIGSEVITPPVVPDTIGVFARTFKRTLSNFGLAGPYILLGVSY